MWIEPDSNLSEIIAALEGDTTLFPVGMTLRLYTNDLTPNRATVLADLTQLTNVQVPGYAATTPAWAGTPLRKQDGSWEDLTDLNSFIAAGGPPPAPQIVYGWYITDAGNTTLAASGRFAAPFVFVNDGDGLTLEGRLNVDQTSGTEVTVTLDMEVE